MESLETELFESNHLRILSFYEGIFTVFSDQKAQGKLDTIMFHTCLDDFLSKGWIMRETLKRVNPELLSELDKILSKKVDVGV